MAPRLQLDARTLRLIAIAFVLLAGLTAHRLFFADDPYDADVIVIDGETMGTTFQIRVAGSGLSESLRKRVEVESGKRLAEVDRWMSNWNPDSEVSRFNAYRETDFFRVSYETAEVVAYALEVTKRTAAAFDITIGPLVARWGFGHEAFIGEPPTQEEIESFLQHMGARGLRVGRGNPVHGGFIRKASPETQLDLSSIAKGYGVDHVAAGLLDLGRDDFLVEIGGEVRAAGERPGGGPWRIAIEQPADEGRAVQRLIELTDFAMATSGDYRIFYRENGQRVSHTIDPRTGRPVEDGPASATVLAPNATVADAWATALMVMGSEGLELTEYEGLAALLLWRNEDGEVRAEWNSLFPEPPTPRTAHRPPDDANRETDLLFEK